jgi:hypothetical protein
LSLTSTPGPGRRTLAGAAVLYAAALAAATWPYALRIATDLPTSGDPPQHLWILRWYRTCLREGRSPLLCPELQFPTGAPLSGFSPLHAQAALFVPLSLALGDDILCYNVVWAFGLITTGLGALVLAWYAVRDRAAAALAGLLVMLSGPVMLHGHGHLELIYLGAFPLFLVAWLRFLDRPGWGRLASAAGLYLVMAACAAYYMVLATAPAALAVAWGASSAGRKGARAWLASRAPWLAGFVALVLPGLAALFAGNLWGAAHGFTVARSWTDAAITGASPPGYVVPTPFHRLGRLLPFNLYSGPNYRGARGYLVMEDASYLGVVTLGLLFYAAWRRARMRGGAFWWWTLALLVVLSAGVVARVGGREVPLPSGWLWWCLPPYRLIRCSARFNLLAAVVAAVPAAAALHDLRRRLRTRAARVAAFAALAVVAVADLSLVPYVSHRPAEPPPVYAALRRIDPDAALLELPVQASALDLSRLDWTYWQSIHRLRTSVGYSGMPNDRRDRLIVGGSPFPVERPGFLAVGDPDAGRFGVVSGADFADYAWLFLEVHGYTHVVCHRRTAEMLGDPASVARLDAQLAGARVYCDGEATAYARDRLAPPRNPVAVCTGGWVPLPDTPGRCYVALAGRAARLVVCNPPPGPPVCLTLEAAGVRCRRTVRLRARGVELARWEVAPGRPEAHASPPLPLGPGLNDLTLESDGEDRPSRAIASGLGSSGRFALYVYGLRVTPAPAADSRNLAGRSGHARPADPGAGAEVGSRAGPGL